MQRYVKASANENILHIQNFWKPYRGPSIRKLQILQSIISGQKQAFAAITIIILYLRAISRDNYRNRIDKLRYTSAHCSSTGTDLVCSGDGSVTPAMVQAAGRYTEYLTAKIEWGITRIETRAFRFCMCLNSITIPESVVYIGSEVFSGTNFTSITFPSSVTELHSLVINSNPATTHVNMAFQNGTYQSENGMIIATKDGFKCLYIVGAGRCNGETLELPSVDKIWTSAVRWNTASIVTIPDSVIEIQGDSFYAAEMHTLNIGKKLQILDRSALQACSKLSTVTLHNENSYFYQNDGVFGKKQTGSSNPQSILWISPEMKSVTIPGTVTVIGPTVLQSCPNLTYITVESTSTQFSVQCNGLILCSKDGYAGQSAAGGAVDVVLSKPVIFLTNGCFRGVVGLKTVTLHSGIVGCSVNCFRECPSLHTVDFASCTMRSGTGTDAKDVLQMMTFAECHSLKTILNWPTNSFSVEEAVFYNCAFETLVIPQQMVAIGMRVFSHCSKLHTVTIPKTLSNLGGQTFSSCTELKNIIFEAGSIMDQAATLAISHCIHLETLTLPGSLTFIASDCFMGDQMLTSINFEGNSGVYRSDGIAAYKEDNNIGYYTFSICPPGISSITLHKDARVIERHAFYYCNKLTHVNTNDLIETVQSSAFLECTRLRLIRFTGNIQFIGSHAIDNCYEMCEVFFCGNGNNIQYEEDPFPTNPKIYVCYDFQHQTLCGYTCYPILDHYCNIPTDYFTAQEISRPYHCTIMIYLCAYNIWLL